MKWVKISVTTNGQALDAVSCALEALGTGGTVFEDGPSAVGYLPADDRIEGALDDLRNRLDAMAGFGVDPSPAEITLRFVQEEDWANAWRQHFHPDPITKRITIAPTWEDYTGRPDEIIIRLDPGMAFGTGGHPTTRLCLQALETLVHGGEQVADVGTGSGVLAIAAALLGAARVIGIDTDPVAVHVARENVEANGLASQVQVETGDRLAGFQGPYDLVIANILPNVISVLAPSAFQQLRQGGTYLVSGLTLPHEEDVVAALVGAGFRMVGRWESDRWLALAAVRD